ncbi:hypothetical protein BBP40_004497, partial [Aspergillus hancockii]
MSQSAAPPPRNNPSMTPFFSAPPRDTPEYNTKEEEAYQACGTEGFSVGEHFGQRLYFFDLRSPDDDEFTARVALLACQGVLQKRIDAQKATPADLLVDLPPNLQGYVQNHAKAYLLADILPPPRPDTEGR